VCKDHRFRHGNDLSGDPNLVSQLGLLALACTAKVCDRARHRVEEQRGQRVDRKLIVAAEHDGQRAVASANIAASNRSINRGSAFGSSCGCNTYGEVWGRSRHVDCNPTWSQASESAVGSEEDLFHVGWVPNHVENNITLRSHCGWAVCQLCSLLGERLHPVRVGAVVDGHWVAFLKQPVGHCRPHDAGSNPANRWLFAIVLVKGADRPN